VILQEHIPSGCDHCHVTGRKGRGPDHQRIHNECATSYEFNLAAAINGNTMAEFDEACPTATPALSPDGIEAHRAEVLVVGELDDETIASIETTEYGDDGKPMPESGLKHMLSDMAASGVWDVESDGEIAEPRLIP
jgi:hypothetical protein